MSKDSLGIINWWGFTPALDIFENNLLESINSCDLNILLIGCGDSRHIIKTISSLYKRQDKTINFYIVENGIELYARYMLQMIISLIPLNRMGLQDKTELFLELYGNGLVREQSMDFVREISNQLIRLISDPDQCCRILHFLNLEHLKFKERDILEAVFKLWRDRNNKTFDMSLCWDLRLRQHLGVRYDAIPNVFDWDCSITLHDRGASIINSREYVHWRHKSIAFQLRDANYDVSNRTMTSGRVLRTGAGDKTVRLGYWGDIVGSPYISFGITSSNLSLFDKSNNIYKYNASKISEYNINEIFYQIAFNKKYVSEENKITKDNNVTITEVDEEELEEEERNSIVTVDDLITLPNAKIIFLPVNALTDCLIRKSKFHQLFDVAYFSASLIGQLETCPSFPEILQPQAIVVIETPQFIVNINDEQNNNYCTRVDEMAKLVGLMRDSRPSIADMEKWGHIVYKKQ